MTAKPSDGLPFTSSRSRSRGGRDASISKYLRRSAHVVDRQPQALGRVVPRPRGDDPHGDVRGAVHQPAQDLADGPVTTHGADDARPLLGRLPRQVDAMPRSVRVPHRDVDAPIAEVPFSEPGPGHALA